MNSKLLTFVLNEYQSIDLNMFIYIYIYIEREIEMFTLNLIETLETQTKHQFTCHDFNILNEPGATFGDPVGGRENCHMLRCLLKT